MVGAGARLGGLQRSRQAAAESAGARAGGGASAGAHLVQLRVLALATGRPQPHWGNSVLNACATGLKPGIRMERIGWLR